MPSPAGRSSLPVKAIVCCLVLFLIHSGCATSPKSPVPPSCEERASFGTVGVARSYHLPATEIDAYAKGRGSGAAKGAGSYFGGILLGGLMYTPHEPYSAAFYLGFLCAVAVVALPVGAVVGATKAMPGGEVASCERLLGEFLDRASPQEDLQDEILRAGAETTNHRLVPVYEAGPGTSDNVALYNPLAGKGFDTVLEVSVQRIALEARDTGRDPPLALVLDARSRLIRLGDGTTVYENTYRHSSDPLRFAEWAADNAALLDREYEVGVREIALAITYWNFGSRFPDGL